jgi:heat shock protein HslJ
LAGRPSKGVEMQDRPLQGIEWRLTHHLGPQGELVPTPEGVMATATFAESSVAGSTGCNRYHAEWRVTGGRLAIGPIAMTMMACDAERSAVERAFTSGLEAAVTYAIAGERLDVADGDGHVVLRLRAAPALILGGSLWIATMINNGRGGIGSLVEGTVVTAEFGVDGRVAGSGGCNRYSGEYTLEGDRLAIGPLASTRKACLEPEGVGEQEVAYLAALARVATWSFREDRLELRSADGALQVEFRPVA